MDKKLTRIENLDFYINIGKILHATVSDRTSDVKNDYTINNYPNNRQRLPLDRVSKSIASLFFPDMAWISTLPNTTSQKEVGR